MSKSVKFAVSIPTNEFKELETIRRRKGLTRSKFIREVIHHWREEQEKEKLVRRYEEGYKRVPENLMNIEAWEKASLNVFSQEKW